jgi:hypothetical protein
MAGVSVGGRSFAFDCESIDLKGAKLSSNELLRLLECLSRGEFTSVKQLNLNTMVILSYWIPRLIICLTQRIWAQNGPCVGDDGAKLIGEMLKVNTTLQWLWLVRVFFYFFVGG